MGSIQLYAPVADSLASLPYGMVVRAWPLPIQSPLVPRSNPTAPPLPAHWPEDTTERNPRKKKVPDGL